ncbi:MAG: hypothetical protein J6V00_02735, partial [Bacteroidaceae bacterium]|nr:hypothetical protein [Bacteroidaceae bacterium]
LKKSKDYILQGELGADYSKRYADNYSAHANLRFATPKIAFDLMYKVSDYTEAQKINSQSLHLYDGRVYDIRQEQLTIVEGHKHNYRAAFEYNWSEKNSLSLAYSGYFYPTSDTRALSDGNF